ncbi:MAG: hypothetical protein V1899_07315 [Planctomycetota bacterium]
MSMTFFILAGEASGDLHAAKLITALKARKPEARFVGMGGDKMVAAGLESAQNLDGMQVVGFWEVIKKYGFFKTVFYKLLDRVKQERPSALICVDYPGFNLRFAKEVRKLGIPIIYYIMPQVWAWKPLRARSMASFVDRTFCVFEFEPPFFEKYGLKTQFVGHPLLDQPSSQKLELPPGLKTVALLPGSRSSEVNAHFGPMLAGFEKAYRKMGKMRCLFSLIPKEFKADAISSRLLCDSSRQSCAYVCNRYRGVFSGPCSEAEILEADFSGDAPAHATLLPAAADFSVVKSGTSTLEAGLTGKPLCVVYKSSFVNYAMAHLLVNIPVFSLVNIVLGRYAIPELLQSDVNPARIAHEIERGLTDEKYREQQRAALAELPKKLGGPGASDRAAKGILDFL